MVFVITDAGHTECVWTMKDVMFPETVRMVAEYAGEYPLGSDTPGVRIPSPKKTLCKNPEPESGKTHRELGVEFISCFDDVSSVSE